MRRSDRERRFVKKIRWMLWPGLFFCGVLLITLTTSGRLWSGPTYPLGMIIIVMYCSVSTTGLVMSHVMLRDDPIAGLRQRANGLLDVLLWMGAALCIVAKVWWGWYVVSVMLICGVFSGRKVEPSMKGKLSRSLLHTQIFSVSLLALLMVYVLLNKSFFSESLLKWGQ